MILVTKIKHIIEEANLGQDMAAPRGEAGMMNLAFDLEFCGLYKRRHSLWVSNSLYLRRAISNFK